MTEEVMADAGAAAENLAPESQTPDVANPETGAADAAQHDDAKPENGDHADKSVQRLQRRVDRVTAARYQAEARAQQLEAELARYRQPERMESGADLTPADIERLATEKAREMRQAETIAEQSGGIRSAAVKAAGGEAKFAQVFNTVVEEAGPLADERTGQWTPLGAAIARKGPQAAAEMLVHLGRNPDVAASLHGLDQFDLAERLAEIRADMRSAKGEPKRSSAPRPPDPVRPVSAGVDPAPGSDGFIAWKMKQLRK